jgi:hypothetical protein
MLNYRHLYRPNDAYFLTYWYLGGMPDGHQPLTQCTDRRRIRPVDCLLFRPDAAFYR